MAEELARVVLRLVIGGIFLAQGYRKVVDADDLPHGMNMLAEVIGAKGIPRPRVLAMATAWVELVGGALVVMGLLTQIAALPLAMIVGIAAVGFKRKQGFFGGWDWPLSVFGGTVAVLLLGPGRYSLDALLGIGLPL